MNQSTHMPIVHDRQVIEGLLSNLPTLFAENRAQTAAFGSAIKGGMLSMVTRPSRIDFFDNHRAKNDCLFVCNNSKPQAAKCTCSKQFYQRQA